MDPQTGMVAHSLPFTGRRLAGFGMQVHGRRRRQHDDSNMSLSMSLAAGMESVAAVVAGMELAGMELVTASDGGKFQMSCTEPQPTRQHCATSSCEQGDNPTTRRHMHDYDHGRC